MSTHETKAEHAAGVSAAHAEHAAALAAKDAAARARNVHEETLETKAIREDIAKLKGEVDAIKAELARTGPPQPQPQVR